MSNSLQIQLQKQHVLLSYFKTRWGLVRSGARTLDLPHNSSALYQPRGGGTPLYKVYRYVPPQRVWFLSRFGLKTGIDFDNYGLKSGRVFGAGNIYESLQTYFSAQYVTGTTN